MGATLCHLPESEGVAVVITFTHSLLQRYFTCTRDAVDAVLLYHCIVVDQVMYIAGIVSHSLLYPLAPSPPQGIYLSEALQEEKSQIEYLESSGAPASPDHYSGGH